MAGSASDGSSGASSGHAEPCNSFSITLLSGTNLKTVNNYHQKCNDDARCTLSMSGGGGSLGGGVGKAS